MNAKHGFSARHRNLSDVRPHQPYRRTGFPALPALPASSPRSLQCPSGARLRRPGGSHPRTKEFGMQTTGVCEPAVRMRLVSLSLCSVEMERPSSTRSKSPTLNCSIASRIEPADITTYPADLKSEPCEVSRHESRPTARTTVICIATSKPGSSRVLPHGRD